MTTPILDSRPLFELGAEVHISASADKIYSVVSEMNRHSEWSSELKSGEWVSGEPGTVGAIFHGENFRSDDVVAWAPLIRGAWHTKSEIVTTDPGHVFSWKIHSKTGEPQELIWTFDITPAADGDGAVLAQKFWMGWASPGIHDITKDMDEAGRRKFITAWTEKMETDIKATLELIKVIIEKE